MVDEVQVENRDPEATHNRSYSVKAPFSFKDKVYEVGEAIALESGEAQPLIEQGLLVNPDGDLPPEDQVAPATSTGSGQASEPVEEPPPKEKKGSRSTDKG